MNIRIAAVTGMKWSMIARIFKQGMQFITMIILARILDPSDFGLMGMALVVTSLLLVFQDSGLPSALIKETNLTREIFTSLFYFNLVIGGIITIILIISAPLISNLYTNPDLTPILRVLAFTFLVSSSSQLQQAYLEKELKFNKIAIYEVVSTLCGAIIGIWLACVGYGVWSLVIQTIVTTAISTVLIISFSEIKPYFYFSMLSIKNILKFSTNLTGFNLVNFFVRNADYFLVGKYLGAFALGVYSLGYRIMLYPIQNITAIVTRVMYPVFSKIQNDNERFKRYYLLITKSIAFISFPLMTLIYVYSEPFVHLFLGKKWFSLVVILQILTPIGLIQSIYTPAGSIFLTTGKTDLWLKWGILTAVVFVSGFVIGLYWGIMGVAMSYLISNILVMYHGFSIPFKLIDLSLFEFFNNLKNIFISCFLMLITSKIFIELIESNNSKFLFFSLIVISIVSYCILIYLFEKKEILYLFNLVFNSDVKINNEID